MLNSDIKCDISELNIYKDSTAVHIYKEAEALMYGIYFKCVDYVVYTQQRENYTKSVS